MKVTNFGTTGLPAALGSWSTGVTSISSNATAGDGGPSAENFVQRITSNTSNTLLNPIVNFQAGSGIALSAASNTITITGTGSGGGGTVTTGGYPVVSPVQYNATFTSGGTSTIVTMTAPTVGNRLLALVSSNGRVCNSITQTNVVWTKLVTNNANGQYCEIWAGVISASAGTTATAAFTGSNNQQVGVVELPSSVPAFTTAGTPTTSTAATTALIPHTSIATAAGDWMVWMVSANSPASAISVCSQNYCTLAAGGGQLRAGILQSNGGFLDFWSQSSSAVSFNAMIVKLS